MGLHWYPWHILVGFCSENSSSKFHTCRCHTCKDIAPEISKPHGVLLGISSLLQSLEKPHGDFFLSGETFPIGKINPYRTSNLGKKSLWEVKPYIMDNIGINSPYQISIGFLVLILYREVDYSHSYSQNISEK